MTAPGGEVDAVDGGGYGRVNITQSVTIWAVGVLGRIIAATAIAAVQISCSDPTCRVVRDGLASSGTPTSGDGQTIGTAGAVRIEHTTISGFQSAGIRFVPSNAGARLVIEDSAISGQPGFAGLYVFPGGGGTIRLDADEITGNGTDGTLTSTLSLRRGP